jgi:capsular exopolysaccharide synthesis family protein
MEFWRLYRLVRSQIWLIVAMMVVAGGVVLAGASLRAQQKEYEAVAVLSPQEGELQRFLSPSDPGNSQTSIADQSARVSDLIMLLRSSNDLYLRTAALLRRNEADRVKEVEGILERNGYFAPVDSDIAAQAARLVAQQELSPGDADRWKRKNRKSARTRIAESFAKGADEGGAFAAGGVTLTPQEIAERIREYMSFDTVTSPLSTENNPQIVNQIRVSGIFERAAEAELYANMLCVAFMDFYASKSAGATNAQIALLAEKRKEANERLQKARREEVLFRNRSGVIPTQAQEAALAQYMQTQMERDKVRQELEAARASVTSYQSIYDSMSATVSVALPTSENKLVQAMEARVAEARLNFDRVKNSNEGEASPIYIAAKNELDAANRELASARRQPFSSTVANANRLQVQGILANAKARQNELTRRLGELERQVQIQSQRVSALPAVQARLADLRREVANAEQSILQIEKQLEAGQLQAIKEGRAGTIGIVSQAHAKPLKDNIGSQRAKLMVYGVLLAFIFGVAVVIGMDVLDNSIRTTADVEKLLELPVVGIIPLQLPDPSLAPKIVMLEPLSPIAESYRLLRTDLLFTAVEKPFRSLMMATGKPGQGSTTTVTNLAIAFAQAGKRVILVDADLRYPKIHNVFHISNDIGLTSLLNGLATLEDALKPTEQEGLWLLPAGPVVLNPSELLSSPRMRWLHEHLKEHADMVLFDTPSAIAFSDAAILSSFLDATLMVIRANNIPRGSEDLVRRLLEKARANILGVVLNGVPSDKVDSVHYHYSYYPALLPGSTATLPSNPHYGNEGPRALGAGAPPAPGVRVPTDVPLALPGVNETGATRVDQRVAHLPAPAPVHASPLNGNGAPAHARRIDAPRPGFLNRIPWKAILLIILAGIAIGALVLLLASGTKVK